MTILDIVMLTVLIYSIAITFLPLAGKFPVLILVSILLCPLSAGIAIAHLAINGYTLGKVAALTFFAVMTIIHVTIYHRMKNI